MKHVVVVWKDVTKIMNDDSFNEKECIDDKLLSMRTSGWLYKESDRNLLLVQEFCDGCPRDWIVIPRPLVVEILEQVKV